jgi:hypothetical protein
MAAERGSILRCERPYQERAATLTVFTREVGQ